MEAKTKSQKEVLLGFRQTAVDYSVPIDIRTGAEAAELLEQGDQKIKMWLPLLCERLEARNAPKAKGLNANRLYTQSVQFQSYCESVGVEMFQELNVGFTGDWLGSAWVDNYGNLRRPGKHRIADRWKVIYALLHEAIGLGAAVNPDVLCKGNVYVESDIRDRRFLTDEEAERLRDQIDGTALATMKSVIVALGFSGGTPMEISLVRKCDIDLGAKTVSFRGEHTRVNPLDDWAVNVIDVYLRSHPKLADDALLCITRQRETSSHKGPDNVYVYQTIKTTLKEMGFPSHSGVTASSLYLTGARWVLEAQGIVAAALFLGWLSLDTTARAIGYEWWSGRTNIKERDNG